MTASQTVATAESGEGAPGAPLQKTPKYEVSSEADDLPSSKYYEFDTQGSVCNKVDKVASVTPWSAATGSPSTKEPNPVHKVTRLKENISEQGGLLKIATQDHQQETKRYQPRHTVVYQQNTPKKSFQRQKSRQQHKSYDTHLVSMREEVGRSLEEIKCSTTTNQCHHN